MNGPLPEASFFEVLLRVAVVLVAFVGVVLLLILLLDFLNGAAERQAERDKWDLP